MNLKDFLQLASQQGKVVVMGEDGNVKGVFLSFDEFQKLSGAGEKKTEPQPESITEKANREILQAQLEEVISTSNGGTADPAPSELMDIAAAEAAAQMAAEAIAAEAAAAEAAAALDEVERIDSVLNKRAATLFRSIPANSMPNDFPYQNFTTPEVTNSNSDEEIRPNFDDI